MAYIPAKINKRVPAWNLVGFFDDGVSKGKAISHFGEVLGGCDELNAWPRKLAIAFAIGSPKIIEILVKKNSKSKN